MSNARAFQKQLEYKVFCILSDARGFRSKSPPMFSQVMAEAGIAGVYVPFMVEKERIGEVLRGLKVLNIAGANVTVPYKEAVIPFLDQLSEGVNIIGSVNTITREGEKLKGYNTNAIGFMDALEESGFSVSGKKALIFGTGGAARAVVFMLNWLKPRTIRVAGRNPAKAREIARRIGGRAMSLEEVFAGPVDADLVVNATSVSEPTEAPELAKQVESLQINGGELLIDLNYDRADSFWKALAQRRGLRFMDGLSVLAHQAQRSFALWTGRQLDPKKFLAALGVS